jgi:hypothetical protein
MKQLIAAFTFILAASFFNQSYAQTADVAPPQYSGIIVMVDDLLGVFANNPTQNPMRQLRILNSAGTVVYQDGNTDPAYEEISLSAAPAGSYTVQVRMQTGWDSHPLVVQ